MRAVIYLIFNEGYTASSGSNLVRRDLCAEAIRLGRLLNQLLPDEAESLGLLALMLLHDSRRDARIVNGDLVTLEDQDRSLWDRRAIAEGLQLVEKALRMGRAAPINCRRPSPPCTRGQARRKRPTGARSPRSIGCCWK